MLCNFGSFQRFRLAAVMLLDVRERSNSWISQDHAINGEEVEAQDAGLRLHKLIRSNHRLNQPSFENTPLGINKEPLRILCATLFCSNGD